MEKRVLEISKILTKVSIKGEQRVPIKEQPKIKLKEKSLAIFTHSLAIIIVSIIAIGLSFHIPTSVLQEFIIESSSEELSIITSEGFTAWDEESKSISVHIKRGLGSDEMEGILITFFKDGRSIELFVEDVPEINGKEVYNFDLKTLSGRPDSISIRPVYMDKSLDSETSKTKNIANGIVVGELSTVSNGGGGSSTNSNDGTNNPVDEIIDNTEYASDFNSYSENVLVIYNKNHQESKEIADYYAIKRNIDSSRICGIYLPTGQFATADELLGARKTIINDCLCSIVLPGACNEARINEISEISEITHLAIIRGIPPRLKDTGWVSDQEEPSLDYYLANMIYRDLNIFTNTTGRMPTNYYLGTTNDFTDFQASESTSSYIRKINTSLDKILAYGRIEAITKNRTFDLINRTISAENSGVSGNFLYSPRYSGFESEFTFFRELSSSLGNECEDYFRNPTDTWPHESCRAGISDETGSTPGEATSKIPVPINAGISINPEYTGNNHLAFDGFNNMINWHKSEYTCTELCEDFTNQSDIDSCKANSKDYFKEINTECVGVAEGFIGFQLRSWPVQYYGFWPNGWQPDALGNWEKTAPEIRSEGTNNYLHFGSNSIEDPKCYLENGSFLSCKENIAVSLIRPSNSGLNIPVNNPEENLTLKFKYRNTVGNGAIIKFYVRVYFGTNNGFNSGENYTVTNFEYFTLDQENLDWTEAEIKFNLTNYSGKTINRVRLQINSHFYLSDPIMESLDLGDIQLYSQNMSPILDKDIVNFNSTEYGVVYGGYASDVIDRLGGIGWWGSGSHFLTGGWAFSTPLKTIGAFYSGRSIGESLAFDSLNAKSGTIYVDPLYNPSGVRLITNDTSSQLSGIGISLDNQSIKGKKFLINAFHGKARKGETNWELSACEGSFINSCNIWTTVDSGVNGVFEKEVTPTLTSFLESQNSSKTFILKLRVWNPGEENNDLVDYGKITYIVA